MALPKSHSQSVLPNPRLLVLETIEQFEDRFLLTVRVQQVPLCPECGRASESRHSHYVRRLQDLPGQGLSVQIHLRVRRFRCRNPTVSGECSPNESRESRLISGKRAGSPRLYGWSVTWRAAYPAPGSWPAWPSSPVMTPCCGASKFPLRPLFPATLPMCSASMIGLGAKDTPTERPWWTWNNTVSWIYCPAGPQRASRLGCAGSVYSTEAGSAISALTMIARTVHLRPFLNDRVWSQRLVLRPPNDIRNSLFVKTL